jgi:hypothetical protein
MIDRLGNVLIVVIVLVIVLLMALTALDWNWSQLTHAIGVWQ